MVHVFPNTVNIVLECKCACILNTHIMVHCANPRPYLRIPPLQTELRWRLHHLPCYNLFSHELS